MEGRGETKWIAAAVYLFGISPSQQNNIKKLHWWAIRYCTVWSYTPLSPSLVLLSFCSKRTIKDGWFLSFFFFFFTSRLCSFSAPAACRHISLEKVMYVWPSAVNLPFAAKWIFNCVHMTSPPMTLLGAARRGWQPRERGQRARPDKGSFNQFPSTLIAPPSFPSPQFPSPLFL